MYIPRHHSGGPTWHPTSAVTLRKLMAKPPTRSLGDCDPRLRFARRAPSARRGPDWTLGEGSVSHRRAAVVGASRKCARSLPPPGIPSGHLPRYSCARVHRHWWPVCANSSRSPQLVPLARRRRRCHLSR